MQLGRCGFAIELHASSLMPHRAKQPEVSLGAHDRFGDWRRASRLTLLEILNSLLDVTDALLHLAGNLF